MAVTTKLTGFASDTLKGLTHHDKYLLSKYMYDDNGSIIFQKIMHMPEYYLMRCELEIFNQQAGKIASYLMSESSYFRLIELGPGDGFKSRILLKALAEGKARFEYMPVDISQHSLEILLQLLHKEFNGLNIEAFAADYFQFMSNHEFQDNIPRIILFLGGNIGNFSDYELDDFLHKLSSLTNKGDKVLIGFDLKKDPPVIIDAYNDKQGYTRDFNKNHLLRINRELGGDFNINAFDHHCMYNPQSGAMKSFLVSRYAMKVKLNALKKNIYFESKESIFMELSRKYSFGDIYQLSGKYGFEVEENFTDSQDYFVDSLWIKK